MAYTTYKRPGIISAICVVGFILVVGALGTVFSPAIRKLGDFYPALFGLLVSCRFIAFVGIWHMKRWGVELFMVTLVAQIIQATVMDAYEINPIGLGIHLTALVVLAFHYRKMDQNL
jgi:hypothetical protein